VRLLIGHPSFEGKLSKNQISGFFSKGSLIQICHPKAFLIKVMGLAAVRWLRMVVKNWVVLFSPYLVNDLIIYLSSYFMPHWMRGPFKLKLNGFSYQKTNKLNLLTKVLNNRNTAAEDRVTF
jgi:hypothetical protein